MTAVDARQATSRTATRTGFVHGLDAVRVVASVAVIYQHISSWLLATGHTVWLRDVLDTTTLSPLHLDDNVGFLGVSLFFLVSGFVINEAIGRERARQFLARRASRLLLPLLLATELAWLLVVAGLMAANRPPRLSDLFTNMVLANYWYGGSVVLGPTWTLVVEFVFYGLAALTIPLHRRWPWVAPALAATLVSVLLSVVRTENVTATGEARIVTMYLPVLFLGQLISLVRSGRLHPLAGIAYGAVEFWLFVRANDTTTMTDQSGPSYPRVLLLALLVVVLCTRAGGPVARARWVGAAARRTYSVYLMHVVLAYPVLHLLVPVVGTPAGIVAALVAVVAGSELVYRYVENPVVVWYRGRERAARAAALPGGARP